MSGEAYDVWWYVDKLLAPIVSAFGGLMMGALLVTRRIDRVEEKQTVHNDRQVDMKTQIADIDSKMKTLQQDFSNVAKADDLRRVERKIDESINNLTRIVMEIATRPAR